MGLIKWIKNLTGNTLYYPGCLTKVALKQQLKDYKEIFNLIGLDFIMLSEEEVCCGLPVINAGYKEDAKGLAEKNFKLFKERKITKIITNCPSCYHTFKEIYSKMLPEWDIEVEHATITILNYLRKKDIRKEKKEKLTYHDSCHLGRYCGIYDEPREVIERLGGEIIEMKNNRENSLCCGAGAGLRANFPELSKEIAKLRAKEIPKEAQRVISACGLCHSNIQTASEKSEEFSTFVLRNLKWKKNT